MEESMGFESFNRVPRGVWLVQWLAAASRQRLLSVVDGKGHLIAEYEVELGPAEAVRDTTARAWAGLVACEGPDVLAERPPEGYWLMPREWFRGSLGNGPG
jgi:hypothetical protein